jgi:hypothetical protein
MAKTIGISKAKGCCAGANIPDLDGLAAKIGGSAEGDSYCTMCGERGHKATAHAGGKAYVRDCTTAGEPEEGESGPSGEALKGDRDSQNGWPDNAANVTGSEKYERPGGIEIRVAKTK